MRALLRSDVRIAALIGVGSFVLAVLLVRGLLLSGDDAHAVVDGVDMLVTRTHARHVPFELAWALLGLHAQPLRALVVVAGVLAVGSLLAWRADDHMPPPGRRRGGYAAFLGALVCFALSALLPVDHTLNAELGDGPTLAGHVGAGAIFGAEIGTALLMHVAVMATEALGSQTSMAGILVVDALSAAAYGGALLHLAWTHAGPRRDRMLLALGLVTSGAGVQLLGYVETTQVLLAATATYLAAAVALADRRGASTTALLVAWSALGVAVISHGAGALLGPSALFLLATSRGRRLAHFVGGWVLVVLPVALVVLPRWLDGDIGNANGGADSTRFVPMEFDVHDRPSEFVYYGLFDWLHLVDLANAVLLAAPALVPALAVALFGGPPARAVLRSRAVQLLAVASVGCLVIPIFWNHDFGMWGDWNLASAYLFPTHVLSWVLLARTITAVAPSRALYAACVLPPLVIQTLGALGIALQLYP